MIAIDNPTKVVSLDGIGLDDIGPPRDPDERQPGERRHHGPSAAAVVKKVSLRRPGELHNKFLFVGIFDSHGTLVESNVPAFTGVGIGPAGLSGGTDNVTASIGTEGPLITPQVQSLLQRVAQGQTVRADLTVCFGHARTTEVDCLLSPLRNSSGLVVQIIVTGVEVSQRHLAESSVSKLNRGLRLLIGCSRALMRAQSEDLLLTDACRAIVENGSYLRAWVGYARNDVDGSIEAETHGGVGYASRGSTDVDWEDTECGNGPLGRGIRERSVQVTRDIHSDPAFVRWMSETRTLDVRSAISVPLISGTQYFGALAIYADVPDAFDSFDLELFEELAGDLAYGICELRARKENERSEGRLRLFRILLEHTNDWIYVVDVTTGRILDVNETASRRLGYTRQELLQMVVADFSVTAAERSWTVFMAEVREARALVMEGRHRCKSGEIVPVEISMRYLEQGGRPCVIAVTRDITERKNQEDKISRLTRILRLQSGVNAAVLRITDRDQLLQEACRLAADVAGYGRAAFYLMDDDGRSAQLRFRAGPDVDLPAVAQLPIGDGTEPDASLCARALRTGEVVVCNDLARVEPVTAVHAKLRALGYKSIVALPLSVDGRRVGVLTLTSRDASWICDEELLLLQEMMASLSFALLSREHADVANFLSYFDPLTGLAKRGQFCDRFSKMLARRIIPQDNLAVAVFDVHNLNHINDRFGRHFGDLILKKVAERLRRIVESDDRIGYLGAGAFAIVEHQVENGGRPIAPLLESNIFSEPFLIEGHTIRLSFSSGVARYPVDGSTGDTLVQRAEAALKKAKASGEQYVHYQLEIDGEIAERMKLEQKLLVALDEGQFEVYYQPQLNIATGCIESVEALLRWHDPEDGFTLPAVFLPVLESSGLITKVGNWMLRTAAEDCERWSRLGLCPVRIAVNVSPLQLRQRTFVHDFLETQRRVAATAGFGLDLEITETVLLQDVEGASRKLRELRLAGVRVALDDFGTGYSSLGLLSKLPVDLIKIDRSFVHGLLHDQANVLLIETVVRLAGAFGLISVAEGVETAAQLTVLRSMGCILSQGFLHSPPVSRGTIEGMLAFSGRSSVNRSGAGGPLVSRPGWYSHTASRSAENVARSEAGPGVHLFTGLNGGDT